MWCLVKFLARRCHPPCSPDNGRTPQNVKPPKIVATNDRLEIHIHFLKELGYIFRRPYWCADDGSVLCISAGGPRVGIFDEGVQSDLLFMSFAAPGC